MVQSGEIAVPKVRRAGARGHLNPDRITPDDWSRCQGSGCVLLDPSQNIQCLVPVLTIEPTDS